MLGATVSTPFGVPQGVPHQDQDLEGALVVDSTKKGGSMARSPTDSPLYGRESLSWRLPIQPEKWLIHELPSQGRIAGRQRMAGITVLIARQRGRDRVRNRLSPQPIRNR